MLLSVAGDFMLLSPFAALAETLTTMLNRSALWPIFIPSLGVAILFYSLVALAGAVVVSLMTLFTGYIKRTEPDEYGIRLKSRATLVTGIFLLVSIYWANASLLNSMGWYSNSSLAVSGFIVALSIPVFILSAA